MLRHPFATNFGVFGIYRSRAIQSFWNHGKIFRNKKVRKQNVNENDFKYFKLNSNTRDFLMEPLISPFTVTIWIAVQFECVFVCGGYGGH